MWDTVFTVNIVCGIHYSLGYIIHSDTGHLQYIAKTIIFQLVSMVIRQEVSTLTD